MTPTVYEHEVIVSGGFRSKELYAYESQTGKPLWGIDLGDDGPSARACEQRRVRLNTESCTIFASTRRPASSCGRTGSAIR